MWLVYTQFTNLKLKFDEFVFEKQFVMFRFSLN